MFVNLRNRRTEYNEGPTFHPQHIYVLITYDNNVKQISRVIYSDDIPNTCKILTDNHIYFACGDLLHSWRTDTLPSGFKSPENITIYSHMKITFDAPYY